MRNIKIGEIGNDLENNRYKFMKKILLLIKVPPPVTGATLMNIRVAQSKLLNDTFDIKTIAISYNSELNESGQWKFRKFKIFLKAGIRLINNLIYFKPNFIYFQISPLGLPFYRDFLYVILLKLFRKKILYHIHVISIQSHLKNKIQKKIYNFAFNDNGIICLADSLRVDLEKFSKAKLYIVNNGIEDLEQNENINYADNNPVKILFLSNLLVEKGIFDLLDALSLINPNNYPYKLIIIGAEGNITNSELQKKIEINGLSEYVTYLGPKYGEEKNDCINSCDIFVFPTWLKHEAFPTVILEAMKYGKPVISTRHAAIPEIVDHGKTGLLVNKKDPIDLSNALKKLIENSELRLNCGRLARAKFEENYTINKFELNIKYIFSIF